MESTLHPVHQARRDRSYFNSGNEIAERAANRLLRSSYVSLRSVSCVWDRGVLRLQGCLPSFYHKQVAQEAVSRVEGVEQVINEIQVADRSA
jgi:osmotically-inducible protein OsmY